MLVAVVVTMAVVVALIVVVVVVVALLVSVVVAIAVVVALIVVVAVVAVVTVALVILRAGCSSVDSVPAFEAVGRRIDPSQWTHLQFGLFSVPTSGPQLVYQRPWYVLFCLWKSAYKRSLAAYRKE